MKRDGKVTIDEVKEFKDKLEAVIKQLTMTISVLNNQEKTRKKLTKTRDKLKKYLN